MRTNQINGLVSIALALFFLAFTSCDRRAGLADAYGHFEADDLIVSAQGNGLLVASEIRQGKEIAAEEKLGQIDTMALFLQKEQITSRQQAVFSQIKQLRAQIEVQKQQWENVHTNYQRILNMIGGGAATPQQRDDAAGQLRMIEKQILAAEAQIEAVRAEVSVLSKQKDVLDDQISKCAIISPGDGLVLESYVERGELATVGKPLYKMARLGELDFRCYLSGQQLHKVALGQKVKVYIDGSDGEMLEYPGTISWISEQSEFTPKIIQTREERVKLVYAVKVRVKNDGRLKLGMPGELRFTEPGKEQIK